MTHDTGDARYSCGCLSCDQERGALVKIGSLCRPATRDPKKMSPGTVPFWSPGSWKKEGWSSRMESKGVDLVTVIAAVDADDIDNGGHLDAVLCFSPKVGEIVTSKRWLIVVADAASPWHSY